MLLVACTHTRGTCGANTVTQHNRKRFRKFTIELNPTAAVGSGLRTPGTDNPDHLESST